MIKKVVTLFMFTFSFSLFTKADVELLKPKCQICTVQKNMIELGDIFDMPPQFEHYLIGESPKPGLKTIIPQSHIQKILFPLGFSAPNMKRITIVRDYKTLDAQKINAFLFDALMAQDHAIESEGHTVTSYDLVLKNMGIKVPSHVFDDAVVEAISLNGKSRRFQAQLRFKGPSDDDDFTTHIEGRAYPIAEFPVLRERLSPKDIIRESHLTITKNRLSSLQKALLTHPQDIIGKSPSRNLLPGKPIYAKDLQNPLLVKKKALVTVVAEEPGLRVTLQGEALSDGCKGDAITVRNTSSKKEIGCTVIGPNRVKMIADGNF